MLKDKIMMHDKKKFLIIADLEFRLNTLNKIISQNFWKEYNAIYLLRH